VGSNERQALEGVVPWPEAEAARYQRLGYWTDTTIDEAFEASVALHHERIAIVDGARRLTYAELGVLVRRTALRLLQRGLQRGDRVLFQLPNTWEFAACYFACLKIGVIPVAGLPAHRAAEAKHLLSSAGARAWLIPEVARGFDFVAMASALLPELSVPPEVLVLRAEQPLAPPFARLQSLFEGAEVVEAEDERLRASRPSAEDVAVFQLSGGTTGTPKIIPRTHRDYLYCSYESARATQLDRDSVLLIAIPASHNFALATPGLQAAMLLGARVVFAPSPSADVVLPLVERERVTWLPAVPAVVITTTEAARRKTYDLSSLQTICVGGQRLNPEPARALLETFGPVLLQIYGMAEGLICCTRHGDPLEIATSTQGRPICEDDEVRIVDEQGAEVEPGAIGELQCRGPYTIRGYYRASEYNATAFTPDGFYCTGDLVRRAPSGNLVVEGRKKDLINRGGEKVSAEDVEDHLLSHPAILQAAVVGMADPVLGERVCAFVVLRDDATFEVSALATYLRTERRIAEFKIPERVEVRAQLPVTNVGKISKKKLREEIAQLLKEPVE
jgi:2,3-dihydroxybenzoate-AMP ligase